MSRKSPELDHDEWDLLIPWYVNGTLNEVEMHQLEGHIAQCDSCRAAVQWELNLAKNLHSSPSGLDELNAEKDKQYMALLEAMDAREARSKSSWHKPWSLPFAPKSTWGKSLAVTASAASVVLALLVGLWVWTPEQPDYQTLTRESGHQGEVVQVLFHPSTPERDIRMLLLELDARILGGPSERGVYRLAIPETRQSGAAQGRLSSEGLMRHPAVKWAEFEVGAQP